MVHIAYPGLFETDGVSAGSFDLGDDASAVAFAHFVLSLRHQFTHIDECVNNTLTPIPWQLCSRSEESGVLPYNGDSSGILRWAAEVAESCEPGCVFSIDRYLGGGADTTPSSPSPSLCDYHLLETMVPKLHSIPEHRFVVVVVVAVKLLVLTTGFSSESGTGDRESHSHSSGQPSRHDGDKTTGILQAKDLGLDGRHSQPAHRSLSE